MSTKFKPTKRREAAADEGVVDDWEAADETKGTTGTVQARAVVRDAWDDNEDDEVYARNVPPSAQGRALWEEANRSAPQAQPIIANRTLPTTLLAPRIATPTTTNSEYDYRPPPQILRRDRKAEAEAAAAAAAALAAQGGDAKKKTMAEREEEYRKARERIFGAASTVAATTTEKLSSRNASGSDIGGRSSPGGGGATKTERKKR